MFLELLYVTHYMIFYIVMKTFVKSPQLMQRGLRLSLNKLGQLRFSKKTRIYSSVVGQDSIINNYNNNNCNDDRKHTREASPPVKQAFSFIASEQGAIIGPFFNLVEKAIY